MVNKTNKKEMRMCLLDCVSVVHGKQDKQEEMRTCLLDCVRVVHGEQDEQERNENVFVRLCACCAW